MIKIGAEHSVQKDLQGNYHLLYKGYSVRTLRTLEVQLLEAGVEKGKSELSEELKSSNDPSVFNLAYQQGLEAGKKEFKDRLLEHLGNLV